VSVNKIPPAISRRLSYPRLTFTIVLGTAAAIAWSQTTPPHSMAVETKPPVAIPVAEKPTGKTATLRYESVFARYKSHSEEKATPWRDANDTVTQIGGWRVYAKEAQQSDPASSSNAAPMMPATPTVAKPNPHEGHGSKQ
jgi:hypothetical protein